MKIGDQCWMAESLKSTHYADSSAISGNWAYDNDVGNAHTYGRLYNWSSVMNGESSSSSNPSGVQGICPDGWHVPSDAEWKELEMTIGGHIDHQSCGSRIRPAIVINSRN